MEQKYLNILEFPKVLERLASYAAFSASKALALALEPSPYLAEVQGWQTETSEADRLLSVKVNIGVGGARDVRPYVMRASRNLILMPEELLEIRQTLIAARELQRTIVRTAELYPRLADIAQRIEECPGVVHAISQAIDDNGQVKDSASPNLARIRRELSVAYGRLMEKLNRVVSSSGQYLQEALITQRGGRYVIPLKSEFKGRIQGIIHDQSGSGATLFIEPLATVDLNNKWRQLQLDEEDEIQKILVGLAELVSSHAPLINHTVTALAELDLAFAKAKYALAIDAVEPILTSFDQPKSKQGKGESTSPFFKLLAARHPLLDPKTVVSIDVTLDQSIRMLVITGPNTGGKTVSLKTMGLLAAMAQAGLRIPAAEGSTLPVFNHILADIGDEQSIEQSLSTFSGHMTNVVQILAHCDENSLVIFDELGAGTDPIEGSALARAILSDLLERNVTTFVATHYPELKAFAYATSGVTNASMEFNPETLTPTYRLLIGMPGASNAFIIAKRLGLTEEIINQAQSLMREEDQQVEAMLAELRNQAEAAKRLRQKAETERQEAEAHTRQIQEKLQNIEEERREILNSARADARREIKSAREKIRAIEAQIQELLRSQQTRTSEAPSGEIQKVKEELSELEQEITVAKRAEVPATAQPQPKLSGPIRPGDKVVVRSFGTTGEVIAVNNQQAEIQLGRFRTSVALADLERQGTADKGEETDRRRYIEEHVSEASPGIELDLRGQVAEEAVMSLDQYLDRAFLARLPWVRIIHGRGSGVLRQVVRQELGQHPMVSSYRPGRENEGGDGVTIATLAVS